MFLLNLVPDIVIHILLLLSIVGLVFLPLLTFVPVLNTYKILINYILIGILAFTVFTEGNIANEHKWQLANAKTSVQIAKQETKAAEITTKVVERIVKQIVYQKGKTETIIKEVPKYVTIKDDSACVIPNGFVQLHDFAAKNEVPDAAGLPDGGTSDVKLSDVGQTVTQNYGTYYEIRAKYIALQQWIKEQEQLQNDNFRN